MWKTVFSFSCEYIYIFILKKMKKKPIPNLPNSYHPLTGNCSLEMFSSRPILLDVLNSSWTKKAHDCRSTLIYPLYTILYSVFLNESSEAEVMQQQGLIPTWNSTVNQRKSRKREQMVKLWKKIWTGYLQNMCSITSELTWHRKRIYNIIQAIRKTTASQR